MNLPQQSLEMVVSDHRCLATGIYCIELTPAVPASLPAAPPGAHVEITLPEGLHRHYSLLDDGSDGRYRIGVLHEAQSRGGSSYLAERATRGTCLTVSLPRNHFVLDEAARRTVLIAGGIGVTPLLAMARRLAQRRTESGTEFELHYLVRRREQAAFLAELHDVVPAAALHLHVSEETGRADLAKLLGRPGADTRIYACGPEALLDAIEGMTRDWPPGSLRLERFRGVASADSVDGAEQTCRVELKRSGQQFILRPGERLLDALEREGVAPASLCQEGICGTCAIPVAAGEVDHRDSLQSADEKRANELMYACVSRPAGPTLILDI